MRSHKDSWHTPGGERSGCVCFLSPCSPNMPLQCKYKPSTYCMYLHFKFFIPIYGSLCCVRVPITKTGHSYMHHAWMQLAPADLMSPNSHSCILVHVHAHINLIQLTQLCMVYSIRSVHYNYKLYYFQFILMRADCMLSYYSQREPALLVWNASVLCGACTCFVGLQLLHSTLWTTSCLIMPTLY